MDVTYEPRPVAGRPDIMVRLRLVNDRAKTIASHEGIMRNGGQGADGYCIEAEFYGVISLQLLLPRDHRARAATVNINLRLKDTDPGAALRSLQLSRQLQACSLVEVSVDGQELGSICLDRRTPVLDAERAAALAELESIVDDLDVVQRHCRVYFRVPEHLDPHDRLLLRFARLLIEGHCVIHPEAQILDVTLTGTDSPAIRQVLSGRPGGIRAESGDFKITIGQRELPLGPVTLFNTQVAADNHQEANRALDTGQAANLPVRLRPVGGRYFRAFRPDAWPDPVRPLVPTPWGLSGVTEPEDISAFTTENPDPD